MHRQTKGPEIFWLFFALFISCESQNPVEESDYIRFVPDNTPFIVGVLEATEDTVHHYPEVYVSTVTSLEGQNRNALWTAPGVWWPILNGQIAFPTGRFNLERTPDTEASVSVTGPLGSDKEKTVLFTHEGKGVYGDQEYELTLEGGETYKLFVTMGDGRRYAAATRIPELFDWEVPDTTQVDLELKQFHTGVHYEEQIERPGYPFTTELGTGYVTYQRNSEYDHFNLGVPEGGFLFEDRGHFLREGGAYGLWDVNTFPDKRQLHIGWTAVASEPLRHSNFLWLSLSQLNEDLSKYYFAPFMYVGMEPDGRWDQRDYDQNEAVVSRDTTYLYKISNILKADDDGNPLPEEQTDAIGVFGGYSAAYRTTVLVPNRSWDPDTLNWGNQ